MAEGTNLGPTASAEQRDKVCSHSLTRSLSHSLPPSLLNLPPEPPEPPEPPSLLNLPPSQIAAALAQAGADGCGPSLIDPADFPAPEGLEGGYYVPPAIYADVPVTLTVLPSVLGCVGVFACFLVMSRYGLPAPVCHCC